MLTELVTTLTELFSKMSPGSEILIKATEPGSTDQMTAQPEPVRPPSTSPVVVPTLSIDRKTFKLGPGQFIAQVTNKDLIVIHFTAGGNARGAHQSWVGDGRTVAAAYLVDLDGRVYECFDPRYWAYALGVKGAAGPPNERRAIQIEIVGWGPLKRNGDVLCSWPKNWKNPYCRLDETSKYVQTSYRGIEYFSVYPEAQLESVFALVKLLGAQFDIPMVIPSPDRGRAVADVAHFSAFKGVAAHQNFRSDKYDVGPAFPWQRLQEAIK